MISVPVIELFIFYGLLRKPASNKIEDQVKGEDVAEDEDVPPMRTVREKVFYMKTLIPYMIPLALVYFFEYFINQGLVRNLKLVIGKFDYKVKILFAV